MLKKIKVYGTLRKFLGQAEFEVDLNTPREAISFLVCNFKDIEKHMAKQLYMIQVGTKVITEDLLNLSTQEDIKIIPVVHGDIFGIALGIGALFGASITSGIIASALTIIGTNLVINGITGLFAPEPEPFGGDEGDPQDQSYNFTGLLNNTKQGVPINIIYGEVLAGSTVVSSSVDTFQVTDEDD